MICFLRGIVAEIAEDHLALDVNGVGYQVLCSSRTLTRFGLGEEIQISIYTLVKEDQFTLFGFGDNNERSVFELLTKVNGVGPKVGLAILSALSSQDVISAITMQDAKMVATANGVGPKLAERIVRELGNQVGNLPISAAANNGIIEAEMSAGSLFGDVLSALVNLGYKHHEAKTAVSTAFKGNEEASFDHLLKTALQELR